MASLPRNSRVWVEDTIRRIVASAPENRLSDYGGQRIFSTPVVGIAAGDSPVFQALRSAVGPRHMLPSDLLARHAGPDSTVGPAYVVSWVLPFTEPIRQSNHGQSWPSRLYSLARNNGAALNLALSRRLAEALRQEGRNAVVPILVAEYDAFRSEATTFSSSWSERHVAYAAGLGRFGLNGSLITSAGANVRLGSIVTDLPLGPVPHVSEDYQAPCLSSGGEACDLCLRRCPVGAIGPEGLDKAKCYAMRQSVRRRCLEGYVESLDMLSSPIVKSGKSREGYSLGCALCQTDVPCETTDPFALYGDVAENA